MVRYICTKCGTEFDGEYCPNCRRKEVSQSSLDHPNGKKFAEHGKILDYQEPTIGQILGSIVSGFFVGLILFVVLAVVLSFQTPLISDGACDVCGATASYDAFIEEKAVNELCEIHAFIWGMNNVDNIWNFPPQIYLAIIVVFIMIWILSTIIIYKIIVAVKIS